MKKVLFILIALLAAQVVSASGVDYYFVVNNNSQADLLDNVIDALNTFLDGSAAINDTAVRYGNLLKFVVMIGIAGVTIRLVVMHIGGNARFGFMQYVIYLMTIIFVLALAYGPRANVMVQTKYNTGYAVKTLPELAAWGFGAFFTVKKELDDLSAIAYDIPDPSDNVFMPGGPEGLGFVGGQATMAGMYRNAQFSWYENGGQLSSKWARYVRDCFLLPASSTVGGETVLNNTLKSQDLITDIDPVTTGYGAELIQYDGLVTTCSDFYVNSLQPDLTAFTNDLNDSSKYLNLGSAIGYFGSLIDDTGAMSNAGSIKAAVTQAVLSNEFSTTFAAMGIAGEVMADGAAQSTADIQLKGIATGLMMAEQLPMVAFVVFLLMVAAFPFIVAFALLPGTLSTLVNYARTLLWVSLWEPMGNILGVFYDYRFVSLARELGFPTSGTGELLVTPSNLINVSSEAATMAGIAGFLFLAVQGLSWMLVTGSGQMIGNLMSHFGSAFSQRADADAQLQARGEMAKRNMLASEMGEQISMREMYQYGAMQEAGMGAGMMGGAMTAFGTDVAGAGRAMTHTGTAKAAYGHGQDIGMTNELGTGTRALQIGQRLSTHRTASDAQQSDSFGSDGMAGTAGAVEGAQRAESSMGNSNAFDNDPTKAGEASFINSTQKATQERSHAETMGSAQDAKQVGQEQGRYGATQEKSDAGALKELGTQELKNVTDQNSGMNIIVKSDAIKKQMNSSGKSAEEIVQQNIDTASTGSAADMEGKNAFHSNQGTPQQVISNSKTNMGLEGDIYEDKAARIEGANVSSEKIARMANETDSGKTIAMAETADDLQRTAQQAKNDYQRNQEEKEQAEEALAPVSEYQAKVKELNGLGEESRALKQEEEWLKRKNNPTEADRARIAEIDRRQAEISTEQQRVGTEVASIRDAAIDAAPSAPANQQKIAEAETKEPVLKEQVEKTQRNADVLAEAGEIKSDNELLHLSNVEGQNNGRSKDEMIGLKQEEGQAATAGLEAKVETAESNGMALSDVEAANATTKTQSDATNIKMAEQNVKAVQERLDKLIGGNGELRRMFEEMGAFDSDPMKAMAAIRAMKDMKIETSVDGYQVSMTSGANGEVRTQFITSMDGIDVGAKMNADYGALAGAKATNEMDVRSQAFVATAKSVANDVAEFTPAGRAMKTVKRSGLGEVAKKWRGGESAPSGSPGGGYVQPRINYRRM